MHILELYQNNYSKDLVVFDSLEEGKDFVSKIPGYTIEKEDNIEYEYFNPKNIPDYMEIIYNENIVPLSRFMFDSEENVEIVWKEISNLSVKKDKIIDGYSKIDAYVINNEEVKAYIKERETKYNMIKDFLETNGYEVDRSFFRSEDGEAIIYRKKETKDWHFLCHLDPSFLDIENLDGYVNEIIEDLL
ncbi:hypothetical protein VJI77_03365 [Parvimonas sp. D2]|uniref:hypothetical protein n=1 Tax=unclassified Parvimonas TaxID=1151464 RepID=UPI002B45A360|nr:MULTISPECIES: hypothetical protein [unclassified Parvimonas]MEB3012032.1 hypothetical protein [Parvimonas sp. D2]MEB3087535.1 hypothetical protein [Parvimonas sp. D4]